MGHDHGSVCRGDQTTWPSEGRRPWRSLFADLTPDQALELTYGVQQYHDQPLAMLPMTGLTADYVLRETAIAGTAPLRIGPGIDIDIPTGANNKKTQPDDGYGTVKAALHGGAHGVLLSRNYSEMWLANIRPDGRAIRDHLAGR